MRLVIVSNRLPVTVLIEQDVMRLKNSVGGVATGLSSYLKSRRKDNSDDADYLWVGWPGSNIPEKDRQDVEEELGKISCHPVFLPEQIIKNFYYRFCNNTLWPLFHYFPSLVSYDEASWNDYKMGNEFFREALSRILKPGDVLWIHDYHFMLLPGMIRKSFPDIPIGFFLHIPFPSFELFQILPGDWRKEILKGLLGSNQIGFHTLDYTHNFFRCVRSILDLDNNLSQIIFEGRLIQAGAFPMGVNFQEFQESSQNPEVKKEIKLFQSAFMKRKTILSFDRLDYTKGIVKRLEGYEKFLDKYASWHGRVILILIVNPSRIEINHYQDTKRDIDEQVGMINGKFGSLDWTPVVYYYTYITDFKLRALYNICDVALITPLRDGMNLIAKEFVSSKSDKKGVLILSEMAGASEEAGEAVIINPNNVSEIVNALNVALEMSEEEQIRRNQIMQTRFRRHDVSNWAEEFIQSIKSVIEEQRSLEINRD
jgi:trehalose 6-phosphate synthase/phosphatase